ncbi:MAG TPA: glycoside hydrolase family 15 protein [Propionibacteriaceae bacterium]|nr:glycoside hydrolase family 15 protein [Propionibacteriaceae bacterium]
MSLPIEDYALLSDCHTGALVGKNGSIDWLCVPRYDSPSVFGALLGDEEHGHWRVAPSDEKATATREYVDHTFVLVTRWTTSTGELEVTDFMPQGDHLANLVRRVRCVKGMVEVVEELRMRFGYATATPWVRRVDDGDDHMLVAIAGPNGLVRRGPAIEAGERHHRSSFVLTEGETADLTLTWFRSHHTPPAPIDVDAAHEQTLAWWREWASKYSHEGPYYDAVMRSLLVLRALTDEETGGIVAAATTSLPEEFGGQRNWDYRYVWLRDAALTLSAFLAHSYNSEAQNWRAWLLRALAGDPDDIQTLYGLAGERYLPERELTSLPGYQGASPVRIGNLAVSQFQGDVIGEVMVALAEAREAGITEDAFSWPLQKALMTFVEKHWNKPDRGIWEIRGEPRAFTQSRVMMWTALDRAIRAVHDFGLDGPVERWEKLRDTIRDEVETHGFDTKRNTYVQSYGSHEVDASLLHLAQVGFCKPDDPRMLGTVAAIEKDLIHNGFVMRYRIDVSPDLDDFPPGENPFLACSFWLVEQYARSGRLDDARELMDRLVSAANDVGMYSEEYDPTTKHHVGNTPQALTHLALVQAADWIARATGEQEAAKGKPGHEEKKHRV